MTEAAAPSPPATKSMIRSVETDPELLEDMMGEKFPYRPVLWAGMMSYRVVVAILPSLFKQLYSLVGGAWTAWLLYLWTLVSSAHHMICANIPHIIAFRFVGSILSLASPSKN